MPTINEVYEGARNAFSSGNYKKASELLMLLIQNGVDDPSVYALKAASDGQSEDWIGCIIACHNVLKTHPDEPEIICNRGIARQKLYSFALAKQDFEAAIRLGNTIAKVCLTQFEDLQDILNLGSDDLDLSNLFFESFRHERYENGIQVSNSIDVGRAIRIEDNIDEDEEGYTVSIYSLNELHPHWKNYLMMSPKQMKVVKKTDGQTILRGYGADSMGNSFSDYGIRIYHKGQHIEKVVSIMHDRNVEIAYFEK